MAEFFSIDFGAVLPILIERVLSLFNKDPELEEWKERFSRRIQLSMEEAYSVQCVGMRKPIPIIDIYQQLHLLNPSRETVTVESVFRSGDDAIIFAGPGRGKTTLLRWLFFQFAGDQGRLPLLFTLRSTSALEDLSYFIRGLREGLTKRLGNNTDNLILLVDGYDEIPDTERKKVSELLIDYRSMRVGQLFLTCRTFYDVYNLSVNHYDLASFSWEDATKFIIAFSKAYGTSINAEELLDELKARGFHDFATHPLMLTLICVLQRDSNLIIPRNSIALLRRATDINPRQLLREIAQWYGVIYQTSDYHWTFAHKTIHDFLAARYWVESGEFYPQRVQDWNTRAAYAACLTPNATQSLICTLRYSDDLSAFLEILANNPPFNLVQVAEEVCSHFERFYLYSHFIETKGFVISYSHGAHNALRNLYSVMTDQFLVAVLEKALHHRFRAQDIIILYLLVELRDLGKKLLPSRIISALHNLYAKRDATYELPHTKLSLEEFDKREGEA